MNCVADPFEVLKTILNAVKDDPSDIVKDIQRMRKIYGENTDADNEHN